MFLGKVSENAGKAGDRPFPVGGTGHWRGTIPLRRNTSVNFSSIAEMPADCVGIEENISSISRISFGFTWFRRNKRNDFVYFFQYSHIRQINGSCFAYSRQTASPSPARPPPIPADRRREGRIPAAPHKKTAARSIHG
jgi:hypothetical protein